MTRILIGLTALLGGLFSVITFNPFTGCGLVQVLGGFSAIVAGCTLVVSSKTFQEL